MSREKLTHFEREALTLRYNLAEGHAKYGLDKALAKTISAQVEGYLSVPRSQGPIEREFSHTFFGLAGQHSRKEAEGVLYCPSASVALEMVANLLRRRKLTVALIEPTFDNLPDILRRHDIPLQPLPEHSIVSHGWLATIRETNADAIFLVTPNNPSGLSLTRTDLEQAASYCAGEGKLLIVDFTFRFFSPTALEWDQYAMFDEIGLSYIGLEDSGKAWWAGDLKVAPILADPKTSRDLEPIYSDIFIHHSALAFIVVTQLLRNTEAKGFDSTVWWRIRANREALRNALSALPLTPAGCGEAPVEWVHIEDPWTDLELVKFLQTHSISVLPGRKFFWDTPSQGEQFVRFALNREVRMFKEGVIALQRAFHDDHTSTQ